MVMSLRNVSASCSNITVRHFHPGSCSRPGSRPGPTRRTLSSRGWCVVAAGHITALQGCLSCTVLSAGGEQKAQGEQRRESERPASHVGHRLLPSESDVSSSDRRSRTQHARSVASLVESSRQARSRRTRQVLRVGAVSAPDAAEPEPHFARIARRSGPIVIGCPDRRSPARRRSQRSPHR